MVIYRYSTTHYLSDNSREEDWLKIAVIDWITCAVSKVSYNTYSWVVQLPQWLLLLHTVTCVSHVGRLF